MCIRDRDANGTEHVRYNRTWNGMPVIGGDFVMHTRNGKLSGISQTLGSAQRPALRAPVSYTHLEIRDLITFESDLPVEAPVA